MNPAFWRGKKVFLTGHTGFKGSWLSLWLTSLGADLTGYALEPNTTPSLFNRLKLDERMKSCIGDVCNQQQLLEAVQSAKPEIVIHMAAQPLVLYSYDAPVETYMTNVMGTVHLLESIRNTPSVKAVVNVTTDKCYENREWHWGYRESEAMGGHDPYSSSKGCAELVTSAYRSSFFTDSEVRLASARAGNVIGGGDWADNRLVPDMMRAILDKVPAVVRNPNSIRPWQHVLEPLSGYLTLAERLFSDSGKQYAQGWNFGPNDEDAKPVSWIAGALCKKWHGEASWKLEDPNQTYPHEATYLKLDISKARGELGWSPQLNMDKCLDWIVEWYKQLESGADLADITARQIENYQQLAKRESQL